MRTALLLTSLAAIAMTAGCVELDGQRISIRYLADKDELHVLLLYDGIHDSDSKSDGKGAKQIPKFVANGDFLLLDWPMHFDRAEIEEELKREKPAEPDRRAFIRALLDSVKSVSLGHYRDTRGRIGAGQLLIVSNASKLVEKANALLNAGIVAGEGDVEPWPRTVAKMLEGAKKGEQWIRIDGHSIVMSFPAHLREWAWNKGRIFEDILDSAEDFGEEEEDEDRKEETVKLALLQALSLAPISLVETPERVTIRLGARSAPSTFRIRLRDSKRTGLDDVVVKHVPVKLDERMADVLVSGEIGKADPGIRALIEWGPPEDRVRALLERAGKGKTPEAKQAAATRLAQFAVNWNRESGYPEAPEPSKDGSLNLEAWRQWYDSMVRFPEK